GGQGARLHARDELRRDGEPRRAPRLDRRDRDHHPRDPAAPQHRARERRRPDRGPRSGARVRRRDRMTLQGRAALVTGAARGIGLAIASRFVAEGARVALVDVDPGVEGAATRLGEQALGLIADVTATAEVERVVASVHQRWGRLDVVVNNAGITGGSRLTWEVSDEEGQRVLAVDLTTVFLVARAVERTRNGSPDVAGERRQAGGEAPHGTDRAARGGRRARHLARLRRVLLLDGRGLRPLGRPRDVLTRVLQQRDLGNRLGDLAVARHADRVLDGRGAAPGDLIVVLGQRIHPDAVPRPPCPA